MHTKKLTVGRTRIHVVEAGNGTPTLFLHGNPDSSDVWDAVIPTVSKHYRCIAPDLPGFGRSIAPDDFDYSLDGMSSWVDDFVTSLGIDEPVNLVVHDIGGPFGLSWAVRNPDKIRSIAIMNTVFHADYRWHLFGRLWRTPIVGEMVQALTSRRGFMREIKRASRKLTRAHINRTYDLITPSVKRMMLKWYRAADPRNFAGWEESLRGVVARKPSLVLWGAHDPYIDGGYATRFGAREVAFVPESGHWLPAEAPGVVATRLMTLFRKQALRDTSPGANAKLVDTGAL